MNLKKFLQLCQSPLKAGETSRSTALLHFSYLLSFEEILSLINEFTVEA